MKYIIATILTALVLLCTNIAWPGDEPVLPASLECWSDTVADIYAIEQELRTIYSETACYYDSVDTLSQAFWEEFDRHMQRFVLPRLGRCLLISEGISNPNKADSLERGKLALDYDDNYSIKVKEYIHEFAEGVYQCSTGE